MTEKIAEKKMTEFLACAVTMLYSTLKMAARQSQRKPTLRCITNNQLDLVVRLETRLNKGEEENAQIQTRNKAAYRCLKNC